MASLNSFRPFGNANLVAASSSTSSTPTAIGSTAGAATAASGFQALWLNNITTSPIYVTVGNSSSAVPTAAVPTTAFGTPAFCVTQYSPKVITCPPNCWVSAATSAGGASLMVQPGFGD
jgi:hypothetical protein